MGNIQDDEIEIDLREIFFAIKRKIFLILAIALLSGCVASIWTKIFITPIYTSMSNMLVLTKETTLSSLADLQLGAQLTKDYTVLINSRPVLQSVIDNLGLDMEYKDLRKDITITNPSDTRILEISVESSDPVLAKDIADELANVSSAYIGDKMEVVPPKIIEEGEIPTERTSPNMIKIAIISILLGGIGCIAIIVILEVLNDTIKTEDDVIKYLELSTLAVVPDRKDYINLQGKNGKKIKKKKRGNR